MIGQAGGHGGSLRSVPFCRSTNAVLILLFTFDNFSAAVTAATVPKTMRKSIFTTRPFSRVL